MSSAVTVPDCVYQRESERDQRVQKPEIRGKITIGDGKWAGPMVNFQVSE